MLLPGGIVSMIVFPIAGRLSTAVDPSHTIAVGLAIFVMIVTNTIHPPAGANPIIVILTGQGISFVLFPVTVGALMLVLFAYLYNKLLKRNYP